MDTQCGYVEEAGSSRDVVSRNMLRISYTEHAINEEVLQKANTNRMLPNKIVNRQVKLFGHVMRKDEVET